MSGRDAQLKIDGYLELPERPTPALRYCKCPRKEPMDDLPDHLEYRDRNCRQRAYRARVKTEMTRVGLPASPSLRAARVSRPTTTHNGDAQNGRKRPLSGKPSGLQVSYYKAVETVQDELNMEREHAEALLERALSARQREQLDQRRAAA